MRQFLILFETKFLVGLRWLFTVVAILMLLGLVGSITWFTSQQLKGSSEDPSDYLETPTWNELRPEVLSIQPLSSQPTSSDSEEPPTGTIIETEIDPNIVSVIETLDSMYARDPTWSFSSSINATRLSTWLSTAISLSEEERRLFNESLLAYVKTLATDPVLDRLANNQDRLKALSDALDAFVNAYSESQRNAQLQASAAQNQAQQEFARNFLVVLSIAGGCFGVLLVLALFIVLMRTEDHLAQIASRDGE